MFKSRFAGIACLALSLAFSHGSHAQFSLQDFEIQLDLTIRSACHGYMIDSIPDFFADTREWLNRETPFCQTVRTLPDSESASDLFWQEKHRVSQQSDNNLSGGSSNADRAEFTSRMRDYYDKQQGLDIECQDWMCQHIRLQAWDDGNPISLSDYQKVAAHCDGSYGCIESWFASWPRALPSQKAVLSLDALLEAQADSSASAATGTAASTGAGLSLDALLAGDSEPVSQMDSLDDSASSGASSAGLSLDSILEGRDQFELAQSQQKIDKLNQRLSQRCQCSLGNNGCYELPSRDLLDPVNQQEQSRYEQCSRWDKQQKTAVTSAAQADEQISSFSAISRQINSIDQSVESDIEGWHDKRRRFIAQQKRQQQQQNDTAFMAGMASILAQSGAVASGSLSAEQAAQNAVSASNSIGNSGGSGQRMDIEQVKSYVPNFSAGSTQVASSGSSANSNFSCYSPSHMICIDYSVANAQRAQQMKNQCSQGNNRMVSSCDRQGASCTTRDANGSQTTFSYQSSASQVRQACTASGGQFREY